METHCERFERTKVFYFYSFGVAFIWHTHNQPFRTHIHHSDLIMRLGGIEEWQQQKISNQKQNFKRKKLTEKNKFTSNLPGKLEFDGDFDSELIVKSVPMLAHNQYTV